MPPSVHFETSNQGWQSRSRVFFPRQGSLGLGGQVSVSGFSCLGQSVSFFLKSVENCTKNEKKAYF